MSKELPALKAVCLGYRDIYESLPEQRRKEVELLSSQIRQVIKHHWDQDLVTMAVAHAWSEITLLQIGRIKNCVAILHEDGDEAVEKFCEQYAIELAELKRKVDMV